MDVKITPSRLKGSITPPPSKSISHRALICAGLAGITSGAGDYENCVANPLDSDDITATKAALASLKEAAASSKAVDVDCNASGSTLRFLIPVTAAFGVNAVFRGRDELPNRPITPYLEELPKHGVVFETTSMPYRISGRLTAGEYRLDGAVSSQFITGLLLALPLIDGDSEILLTSPLQSKPYVNITLDVMKRFGVEAVETASGYSVRGNQVYNYKDYKTNPFIVEADMSQAAFFAVANKLGAEIEINGLNPDSMQGDKKILDIVKTAPPYNIDAADIPDLVPVLTVLCALTEGEHLIYNCSRLRYKECDRLTVIATELNNIGADVRITADDSLAVTGVKRLKGGVCESWKDHRIPMAMSVAALGCEQPLVIKNAECVNKSYARFFEDYKSLGGMVDVVDV